MMEEKLWVSQSSPSHPPEQAQEESEESEESCCSLSSFVSPCEKVRSSCQQWYDNDHVHHRVRIDQERIAQFVAEEMNDSSKNSPSVNSSNNIVTWDSEGWHYTCPLDWPTHIRFERMALYILALDAINFCFWPTGSTSTSSESDSDSKDHDDDHNAYEYEYEDLAVGLSRIASADHDDFIFNNNDDGDDKRYHKDYMLERYALSPSNLATISVQAMTALFANHGPHNKVPPNISQRCALWNELGTILLTQFDGSATNLLEAAHGSAPQLVHLLVTHFPGFRDYYCKRRPPRKRDHDHDHENDEGEKGIGDNIQEQDEQEPQDVWFLKRAQICVADLNACLQPRLNLRSMDQLTTFADYRVPQLLRDQSILVYSPTLAQHVDDRVELLAGSDEECSIRAATVVAVEWIVSSAVSSSVSSSLHAQEVPRLWTAVDVDWFLWQLGERKRLEMRPHHRTRTTFY